MQKQKFLLKGFMANQNYIKKYQSQRLMLAKFIGNGNLKKAPFKNSSVPVLVDISPLAQGQLEKVGDYSILRIKITAKNAYSIAVYFDKLKLSKNAEIYLYNPSGTIITGPITEKENLNGDNLWASNSFVGNSIIIELKSPHEELNQNHLHIKQIRYGIIPKQKAIDTDSTNGGTFGASSPCNVNVICYSSYTTESKAVAYVEDNEGAYTASLIMNTCGTSKPYILTANHNIYRNGNLSNLGSTVFEFLWISSTCSPSTNTSSTLLFNGATLQARWENTDFALLELNQVIPSNSGLSFLGWSRSTSTPSSAVSIHHPARDIMKISFENSPASIGNIRTFSNTAWRVQWDIGTIESGSSEGPLLDPNKRVIGQHFSNTQPTQPPCNQTTGGSNFGRFDLSWDGGGTSSTRLKDWLDPSNSGAMTTNTTDVSLLASASTPIVGDNFICTGSKNYTITSGTVTSWSILPSSGIATIQPNGNNVTVTAQGTGSITLTAYLCGMANPIYKNISIGAAPVIPSFLSFGSWNSMPNPATNLYGSVCRTNYYPYSNPIQVFYGTNVQNLVAYSYSGGSYPSVYQNTITWYANSGTLRIEYDVACGHVVQYLHFTNTCGFCAYSLSPNPANSEVTITEQSTKETIGGAPKAKTVEIVIVDQMEQIKLRKTFGRSSNYKLNVSSLPLGVYIVRIVDGENVYSEKLLIKK